MEMVHTSYSRDSKGHYAPAVIHNGIAYISGQLPINYENGETKPCGDIEAQTRMALQNLERVLLQCGSRKELVLKTTIYIPGIEHWQRVNAVYAEFFAAHKPARSIVPTLPLHFGALVEIEAIAVVEEITVSS
jgi:2-iminobutanoate/2-iminopropanoate deaminase